MTASDLSGGQVRASGVTVKLSNTGKVLFLADFDPPGEGGFGDARRCALWLRDLLATGLGLTCYVKASGGKGLHVHLPLNRRQDFEEALRPRKATATATGRPGTVEPAFRVIDHCGPNCP